MDSMMLVVLLGVGAVLYLKGCSFGIQALCHAGQTTPAAAASQVPITTVAPLQTVTANQVAPVSVTAASQPEVVMEFIANQVVQDIDANTFAQLSDSERLNMKSVLLGNYKNWLYQIAEFNQFTTTPLQGQALAKYSSLILDVCNRMHINLNPASDAMYRAQLFAGTPLFTTSSSGNTTTNTFTSGLAHTNPGLREGWENVGNPHYGQTFPLPRHASLGRVSNMAGK
jgi:hypothetical protein